MCAAFYYEKSGANFAIGAPIHHDEPTSLSSLPFDKRHYKKDSRFVNDLYTLTYDDHESLDSVRLFSTFANQVSVNYSDFDRSIQLEWAFFFSQFTRTKQWLSQVSVCVFFSLVCG